MSSVLQNRRIVAKETLPTEMNFSQVHNIDASFCLYVALFPSEVFGAALSAADKIFVYAVCKKQIATGKLMLGAMTSNEGTLDSRVT